MNSLFGSGLGAARFIQSAICSLAIQVLDGADKVLVMNPRHVLLAGTGCTAETESNETK